MLTFWCGDCCRERKLSDFGILDTPAITHGQTKTKEYERASLSDLSEWLLQYLNFICRMGALLCSSKVVFCLNLRVKAYGRYLQIFSAQRSRRSSPIQPQIHLRLVQYGGSAASWA